jgi:S1-C subfamily serine protease
VTSPALNGLVLVAVGLVLGAAIALPAWWRSSAAEPRAAAAPAPVVTPAPVLQPLPEDLPETAPPPPPAEEPVHDKELSLEDLVARAVPAVASIQAGNARGTGFFVRADAIVTNAHVIDGQTAVRLQVGDRSFVGRVMAVSPGSDLAVIQVERPNPSQVTLELGSTSQARVGQEVIAIGSALGVLSNTVTRGIVSAVRQVGPVTLVQTDAAINPGNSGGPLLDREGKVIGVNSMAVGRQTGEGVAFAVAIDHVTQLLDNGRALPASQTPLRGLEQMFGKPSDGEDVRARGERQLAQAFEVVARNAEQIDAYWARNAPLCVTQTAATGDRPWFGVFARDGIAINPLSAYDCASFLKTLAGHASTVRQQVDEAVEQARRSGVFAGTVRNLRRRHRLTWD